MAAEKDIGKVALSGSRKVLKKAVQRVYQKVACWVGLWASLSVG